MSNTIRNGICFTSPVAFGRIFPEGFGAQTRMDEGNPSLIFVNDGDQPPPGARCLEPGVQSPSPGL